MVTAAIKLDIEPRYPEKQVPIVTWGSLFKLRVSITDDRGKEHAVEDYSYCEPHNPNKESKSVGRERF